MIRSLYSPFFHMYLFNMPTRITPMMYVLSTLTSTIGVAVNDVCATETPTEPGPQSTDDESIYEPNRNSMLPQPQNDPSMTADKSTDEPVVSIDKSMDEAGRSSMWLPQPQHDPSAAHESTDEPFVSIDEPMDEGAVDPLARSAFNEAISEHQMFHSQPNYWPGQQQWPGSSRSTDADGVPLMDNDNDSYYSPTILQEDYSCFRTPSPDPSPDHQDVMNQYIEASENIIEELGLHPDCNTIQDCSHIISRYLQEKTDAPTPAPIAKQPRIIAVSKAAFVALSRSPKRPRSKAPCPPSPPGQPVLNNLGVAVEDKRDAFAVGDKRVASYKHRKKMAPRWHQRTIAPRALKKNKKRNFENVQK